MIVFLAGCQILGVQDKDLDEDGDGFNAINAGGPDCNDEDPDVKPGVAEILRDRIDQNCNGHDDEDWDRDGMTVDEGDCDDLDPAVRLRYFEYQDGVDNDCDGEVDEENEPADAGVSLPGEVAGDQAGAAIASGDVDQDGYSDVFVAAPEAMVDLGFAGKVYGVKGRAADWGSVTSLAQAEYAVTGVQEFDRAGTVAVGDMDGDSVPEVAIGALGYDVDGGNGNGAVGIFRPLGVGVTSFAQASPWWWGDASFAYAGGALAFVGDIDGDGGEELVVGAHGEDRAYVLSWADGASQSGPLATVAAATLQGTDEDFGWSVAGGEDLDGDGLSDYAVGAYTRSERVPIGGAVYVYAGGDTEPTILLEGDVDYAKIGYSVALVSDVDGDGYAELLAGAPAQGARGDASRGVAHLLLGEASWTGRSLDEATQIQGQSEGEFLGVSVAGVGDVDSDGLGDFAVGSLSNEEGLEAGAVYLFLGGSRSYAGVDYVADPNHVDAVFLGTEGAAAYVVAGVGNTNGKVDGDWEDVLPYDDFVLGAPGYEERQGAAFLFFGQPTHVPSSLKHGSLHF